MNQKSGGLTGGCLFILYLSLVQIENSLDFYNETARQRFFVPFYRNLVKTASDTKQKK